MPSDEFLVSCVRGGDEAALRSLMDRYDRLVRFAIFRLSRSECRRDPQWLETIAADTWIGFVRSLQRNPQQSPRSVTAYLCTVARFKVVSALRRLRNPSVQVDDADAKLEIEASIEDPIDLLVDTEALAALRDCVRELEPADQVLWGQVEAILERKWVDAARELGTSESTLRSRWKRTLERLRECVRGKTGTDFAPGVDSSDP